MSNLSHILVSSIGIYFNFYFHYFIHFSCSVTCCKTHRENACEVVIRDKEKQEDVPIKKRKLELSECVVPEEKLKLLSKWKIQFFSDILIPLEV